MPTHVLEIADLPSLHQILCEVLTMTSADLRESLSAAGLLSLRYLDSLVDPGTLHVTGRNGSAVITALGQVCSATVTLFACDDGYGSTALSEADGRALSTTIAQAAYARRPVVGVWNALAGTGPCRTSGAWRSFNDSQNRDPAPSGIVHVLREIVAASGRVPQISLVLGPATGAVAYGPALTDFVLTGPRGRLFLSGGRCSGPVSPGTDRARASAPAAGAESPIDTEHVAAATDEEAVRVARRLLLVLAEPNRSASLAMPAADPRMAAVLPASPRRAYDVHALLSLLLDEAPAPIELQAGFARGLVTMIGHLAGATVGVVANNPLHRGGCLDCATSEKAARFVRTCDALGIPLVVIVDVPGYLPGRVQEWDGVVRRGAKLLYAFAEASVPRVTILIRKAYGGAFIGLNSKALGATAVYAWPTAEIGVMDPKAAVAILHRRTLESTDAQNRGRVSARLAEDYQRLVCGLESAVRAGAIDRIIDPGDTRRVVAGAIASASGKRGRHSNIPL